MINHHLAKFCGTPATMPEDYFEMPRRASGQLIWTPEADAMVRRLAVTHSLNQIALEMRISYSSVQSYCRKKKIKTAAGAKV